MSPLSLEKYVGQVAVVTGASAGIGKAVTETLVKSGIIVAALARRVERLEELAKELSGEKGKVHTFKCDVTKETEILETFKQITSKLGPIHILVNNAGIARYNNIIGGDTDQWKSVLDTNVLAVAIASREAIHSMKENNVKGHIININSIAGHTVLDHPGIGLYSASKFSVTAMTETLRLEINREKLPVKITSISPGYVRTELAIAGGSMSREVAQQIPGLEAADLADSVVYVLSTPDHVNMDLTQINQACIAAFAQPLITLISLKIEEPQPIFLATLKKTKFGSAILLNLRDNALFLPQRVTETFKPHLDQFVDGKYSVVFKGTKDIGKGNPLTLFEIVAN